MNPSARDHLQKRLPANAERLNEKPVNEPYWWMMCQHHEAVEEHSLR
jgi:hypothetical protein